MLDAFSPGTESIFGVAEGAVQDMRERQQSVSGEEPEGGSQQCRGNHNVDAAPQKVRSSTAAKPQATRVLSATMLSPAATKFELPGAKVTSQPKTTTLPEALSEMSEASTLSNHQLVYASDNRSASGGTDEGQEAVDAQLVSTLVGEITAQKRRYDDLRRAHQRLDLQAKATCRLACGGDKVAGAKLYEKPTDEVAVWLLPYTAAMEPLSAEINRQEKVLEKMGKQLPVAGWAKSVPGLSPRFLAMIVGECALGPGEYRSPSALWKRMGCAVIGGGRQRRVAGDAAIEHGYVARRRSLMWNVGNEVAVRQGTRKVLDADGKDTGERFARTEWGRLYLDRKAYELSRGDEQMTRMWAHNRAKRYVEKRLLKELWRAWRRATGVAETTEHLPAADGIRSPIIHDAVGAACK